MTCSHRGSECPYKIPFELSGIAILWFSQHKGAEVSNSDDYKPLPVWAWISFTYLLLVGLIQTVGILFSVYAMQLKTPYQLMGLAFVLYVYRVALSSKR